MGLNCGIVGLPNVGKSTIFSALTSAPAEVANYPFCTIEPNVGLVSIPDARLYKITEFIKPQKIIPAITEFVDIAGLVKGASKGEGLGNKFLGHIKQVGAIAHVVRCFEDPDVVHVHGKLDPISDISVINFELAIADLETVEKRLSGTDKMLKSNDKAVVAKAKISKPILEGLVAHLSKGLAARSFSMNAEELSSISDLHLITLKKQIYVCNVDEDSVLTGNSFVETVKSHALAENCDVVLICGKIEAEISKLDTAEEKKEFLKDLGIDESGLSKLIKAAYTILGLRTYFTAGEKEVRAWTFQEGNTAPQAAGVIHTDFEKGFIKAETYHCEDLFKYGSEKAVREAGKLRMEGKEYLVKDGDIMHFRFNV